MDGRRFCSTDLALRGRVLTVGLRADAVGACDEGGCSFAGTGTGTGAHPPTRQTPPPSWPRSWR